MNNLEQHLDSKLSDILPKLQSRFTKETTYFGIKTLKNPLDFWVYQEIIHSIKPDFVIEIGTAHGGSALGLAHMLDHINKGQVITLDIDQSRVSTIAKEHKRITFIEGDAKQLVQKVKQITNNGVILVIEDSAHAYDHSLEVLKLYSPLVSMGSYFIVEDGICHHGLDVGPNPGPYEAIETFMIDNKCFKIDHSKENFIITWNPCGYLKRIK